MAPGTHPARHAALGCLLAATLLTGCQTDNLQSYNAPIEARAGMAPPAADPEDQTALSYKISDLQPNGRPALNSDEDSLWLLVDKMEGDVKTAGNRITDEKLNAYVKSITCRISGPHCTGLRVYVMRVPAFNASMAPNGMMIVWSGLLLRVRNEAQIAAVIGHETGHYLRRHSLQRMRNIIGQTNSLMFLQFAMAGVGAGGAGGLAQLAVLGGIQAFSRDNEREADGYGILLMKDAGYDPREASKVWAQLERERAAEKDPGWRDPFLASHPASGERELILKRLGEKLKTGQASDLGRDRFLDAVLPVRAGLLRDELHQRKYDTFAALLDMLMEDGANMAELHYFKGELHRLRARDGDFKIALDSYLAAKMAPGTTPSDIDRSMALVYRKLDKREEARAALRRYLGANPNAPDAALIHQMLGP